MCYIILLIIGAINLIQLTGFKFLSHFEGWSAFQWALEEKLLVFLTSVLYEGKWLANLDRLDHHFFNLTGTADPRQSLSHSADPLLKITGPFFSLSMYTVWERPV